MQRILLAGCGKMGTALLGGWLKKCGDDFTFTCIDPVPGDNHPFGKEARVEMRRDVAADMPAPDVIVLAVKPQSMGDALPPLAKIARGHTLWLSIAAGIGSAQLAAMIGDGAAHIIRAMPNTPAAIGKGITAYYATPDMPEDARRLGVRLLEVVGAVVRCDDEAEMDAVTAVSGSGPAYVFLLCEALEAAARAEGLDDDMAAALARETVIGAAGLLAAGDEAAADLRKAVTSPGGTTEAALGVLMAEQGLGDVLARAVHAAAMRSKELGKG